MICKRRYLYFILFAIGLISILFNSEIVLGDEERELYRGDFVRVDGLFLRNLFPTSWIDWFEDKFFTLWNMHIAMYDGSYELDDWWLESGPGPVHLIPNVIFKYMWDDIIYFYVNDIDQNDLDQTIRDNARGKAWTWMGRLYQYKDVGIYNHYQPFDVLEPIGYPPDGLQDWIRIQFNCVRKFQCAELVWAAYMQVTDPQINISCYSKPIEEGSWGYSESSYKGVTTPSLSRDENNENMYVTNFTPVNPPSSNQNNIDIIIDGNLAEDDPENKQWTTIQKGIDNASSLDVLFVKNYNYIEDIVVDKSVILIGEDMESVGISGSVSMVDRYDYELPDNKNNDYIHNVNMTGNELLMHLNNETENGEDYGSTSIVYDSSGQSNNGSVNGAIWNTSALKGNGSFSFDGNDDFISISNIAALTNENVTISAWIKWNDGMGAMDPIISQNITATQGYRIYINNSLRKPVFQLGDSKAISSSEIGLGWHNIVGTHNSTTLKIYVDGHLQGTSAKIGNGNNYDTYIGYDGGGNYFYGVIDEVAIWNRTLSMDEITHLSKLNCGFIIENLTIKDSNIGVKLSNYSIISNCNIINNSIGIEVNDITNTWIMCNVSDCDTGILINTSNPEINNLIWLTGCFIENNSNGIIVNSSSNIDMSLSFWNGNDINMMFNDCNISSFNIFGCTSYNTSGPDILNLSGPILGDPDNSYTYYSCINESDGEQWWYQFDWGDGNTTDWIGPYIGNVTVNASYSWDNEGGYYVRITAKDVFFNETEKSILFQTETLPPLINSVENAPDLVGFGENATITVNATDDDSGNASGIQSVSVNITYPDDSYLKGSLESLGNNTFEYVFTDTWLVGQHNYTIFVLDNAYNSNTSSGYCFNVSVQANMSVCMIKDTYGAGEDINITDPPGGGPSDSDVGYELLDDGGVLRIWNKYDSYYFNTSSGIQLTNHYDEYWTHNVLMLGYYNNDQWNLIYRTDELIGFNKDIDTDNETYVNATIWKNLTYSGYDFRLAIRYHLGVDDNELTVIPYIKNLGQNIPYTLGFAWEINNIQIDMTPEEDYIEINRTSFYLNDTVDVIFRNMTIPIYCWNETTNESYICGYDPIPYFYVKEDLTETTSESLYLRWDPTLDYRVKVKSKDGEYNAPVTLAFKIGTLDVGQEKYTELFWHDASEIRYYFNSYDEEEAWATSPGNMIDSSTSNYASTTVNADVELCDGNTCSGSNLGSISKVELRVYGYYSQSQRDIILQPVFDGENDGGNYTFKTENEAGWSQWFDITNDAGRKAESQWTWNEVKNLDCDVKAEYSIFYPEFTLYCSKVEVRVTFTGNTAEETYFFIEEFESDWEYPEYMVDGDDESFAYTERDGLEQYCLLNICKGEDLGTILKVELRTRGYREETAANISLTPVFGGEVDGSELQFAAPDGEPAWSEWFDITNDANAPSTWNWIDVKYLDCKVKAVGSGEFVLYCSKIEIRVNHTSPANNAPQISNPYPEDGSNGISLTPALNITVSDPDKDVMNITWYSNSSGSWQVFGTNIRVTNGTYNQTFANATENGKWWYWNVSVNDGADTVDSSVYKFYTGYQSKIKNTGSTSFRGYLLMQVHYYNESSEEWAVVNDTINETSPRTLYCFAGEPENPSVLALDTIFNGLVNTNDLSEFGDGTYRVYATFRDPDGDALVCDDETALEAWYEFEVDTS